MKKITLIFTLLMCIMLISIFNSCYFIKIDKDIENTEHSEHVFGDWNDVKKATCTQDGLQYRKCYCGEEETRTVKAMGHIWNESDQKFCTVCGISFNGKDSDTSSGNTSDTDGGNVDSDTDSGNVDSGFDDGFHIHKFVEWKTVKEPTCTASGRKESSCYCGVKSANVIDAKGHINVGGKCPDCGKIIELGVLKYQLYEDCYAVCGIGTCIDRNIVIPSTYKGKAVTEIRDSAFEGCYHITNIEIPDTVTRIGESAFKNCSGLTSIDIPDSVTRIGASAFKNCSGLTSIDIPDSVTRIDESAFESCSGLTSVEMPDGITSISESLFKHCSNLVKINIPETVGIIQNKAFFDCSSLTDIVIPSSVTVVKGEAFAYCDSLILYCETETKPSYFAYDWQYKWKDEVCPVVWNCNKNDVADDGYIYAVIDNVRYGIKDKKASVVKQSLNIDTAVIRSSISYKGVNYEVTGIVEKAFALCKNLKIVEISNGITSIEAQTFENCSNLIRIELPDSLVSIGSSAFENCTSLTTVKLPSTVTSIGDSAFDNCTSLTNVKLPSTLTSISDRMFENCTSLTNVEFPSGIVSIGNGVFQNCTSLTNVELPDSITSIGSSAFEGCESITNVKLPSGITTIKSETFYYCKSLENIEIPSNITEIESYAFFDCTLLESVRIPANVNSIGNFAFGSEVYKCSTVIYCEVAKNQRNWWSDWNGSLTVVWDCNNNEIADDGYIPVFKDGVRYGIKDGEATVTDAILEKGKDVVIPPSISYKNVDYPITSVGEKVFSWISTINVTLPNSVTRIAKYAFSNCMALTVKIPDSVSSIEKEAFYSCEKLEIYCEASSKPDGWDLNWHGKDSNLYGSTIIIWDCNNTENQETDSTCFVVDGIKYEVRYDTAMVSKQSADVKVAIIAPYVTYKETVYSVTSIDEYAFNGCKNLVSVSIPNTVTDIDASAFYGCTSLTSIEIPDSVTSIDEYAFYSCTSLTSIEIPDSVSHISESVFGHCESLENVVLPNGMKKIGEKAFLGCTSLKSITVPSTVDEIRERAFEGCVSLENVKLSQGLLTIKEGAFKNCTSLPYINVPQSVKNIEQNAFFGCENLVIGCCADEKCRDWSEHWNSHNCPVAWGYIEEEK